MLCDANANEIVASGTHRQQAVQTQRQRHALQAPKLKLQYKNIKSGFPLPSADKFPCGTTDQFKTSNATAYELTESHTPSEGEGSELEPLSARVRSIIVEPLHDGVEPLRSTRGARARSRTLWRRVTLWPPLEHLISMM